VDNLRGSESTDDEHCFNGRTCVVSPTAAHIRRSDTPGLAPGKINCETTHTGEGLADDRTLEKVAMLE
jgi:hypothetical protein